MASKKEADRATAGCIIGLVGIVLLIPSLVLAIFYFFVLKSKYLQNPSAQRIVDTPRMLAGIGVGGMSVGGLLFLAGFVAFIGGSIAKDAGVILLVFIAIPLVSALLVIVIYIFRIPVLAMGIIGDQENDKLFFPCDMQSYTLGDYAIMRFVKDACSVDSVNLSEINKLTRGYGVDLYVHGEFGSRKITMSTKQKRDECLAMIQAFVGKKGLVFSEMERY